MRRFIVRPVFQARDKELYDFFDRISIKRDLAIAVADQLNRDKRFVSFTPRLFTVEESALFRNPERLCIEVDVGSTAAATDTNARKLLALFLERCPDLRCFSFTLLIKGPRREGFAEYERSKTTSAS
jgi:hypothetical protein